MANIKGFLGAAGVAAAASLAMSSAALADDAPKFGYSLTITGVTDYIFRGVSYTDGQPAFQPYLELTYGKPDLTWYLGFWGSNIHTCPSCTTKSIPNGDPNAVSLEAKPWEFDIYAGVRPVTNWFNRAVNWDIGALWYTYPESPAAWSIDYVEFKVSATTSPMTNLTVGFNAFATPDQSFAWTQTETIEGTAAYVLPNWVVSPTLTFTPTVSGLFGYTHSDTSPIYPTGVFLSGQDYVYWNAGVKLAVDKYFMDFRYWDTNINDNIAIGIPPPKGTTGLSGDIAGARFVFSAGVTLP
jgi:uncharacterized protein (TIGR02001 family)